MTQRQRFLDILRSVSGSSSASRRPSDVRRNRHSTPLRVESLEDRRVLAVAITDFTPTDSGFVVEFDEAVDTSTLNLYDTESGAMGPADVTLTGTSTGAVDGSLVVDGNTLTFVATVGLLPADTYSVVLRSAENGFKSQADGQLLDGDNSGTAGGNFSTSFTVSASTGLVVSIPDFARGPSQSAQAPASGAGATLPTGLPVQLSNAAGVTSMTVTLEYDPALLEISDIELGADAPQGSQIEVNLTTPGSVTVAFFTLDPMPAGEASVFELIGQVPSSAPYGTAHVLRMTSIDVNAGAIAARTDDALHVVAFAGDVNANRRYDAEDARLIARVGVGLDTGFVTSTPTSTTITQALFPLIDPVILGDVTGAGGISPLDASDVLRKVVGLAVPNLPDLPSSQGPFALSLSNQSLSGSVASGVTVGTLTTSDPDTNDTFTYSLVTGSGATDNALFSISGSTLRTASALTPSGSPYSIRVRTTDAAGNSLERIFSITVTANNSAPTGITLSASSFAESTTPGTTVATLASTDANAGDTFTYSLVSGNGSTDNSAFSISGNQLVLSNAVNFETKSSYSVRLRTTDQGGASFEQSFSLTVTNSNDPPTAIAVSATDVALDAAIGTLVGNLSTTDEDTADSHTYSLVSGTGATDNALFSISGNQIRTAASLSSATQSSYSIRVRSTDSGGAFVERVITGSIVNGNVAPSGINLSSTSFPESTPTGTAIATLSSVDANAGDTFTYSLVSGTGATDNAAFTVSGNQLLLNAAVDFEAQSNYSIRLRTTDAGGQSFEQVVALTVTDSNDSPTAIAISATDVVSGVAAGAVVGTLSTTDQDASDTHTYSLVSGIGSDDNSSFTISGNQLLTAVSLDVSTQTSYSVRVRSTDASGAVIERVIVGDVVDTNVAPTGIDLTATNFPESTTPGTTLATISSVDANPGETFTYSLVAGIGSEDNSSFTINGDELLLNATVDFETKSSYSIRLRTTDSQGLTFEDIFEMRVTDSNDVPQQISISATDVPANTVTGTLVGTLSTFDQDAGDTHTYTFVTGTGATDNDSFTISGDQLLTAVTFDGTTQSSYSIRIRSTDSGGEFIERIVSGSIVNGNTAPTGISLSNSSFDEATAVGTTIATLSSTDANLSESFTYALVDGVDADDNGSFVISGDELILDEAADFEAKSQYNIRLRTTDAGGLTFEQAFVLTVIDSNDAPVALTISSSDAPGNVAAGATVGTLTTSDQDNGDTHTYSLVTGDGSTDNASFTISGDQLVTAAVLDPAILSSYSVRVRSTDSSGEFVEQIVTGNVVNTNLAPINLSLSGSSVAEDVGLATLVGTFSTSDPNLADVHAYELVAGVGGDDNAAFAIVGSDLRTDIAFDFETKSSYSILVRSTDTGGLSIDQQFTISITNVNEAATQISLSNASVTDASPSGTVVGDLSANDPDAGDTLVFALATGAGDTDNSSFSINGTQLVTNFAADLIAQSSYSLRVSVTDALGLVYEEILSVTVVEQNAAPTSLALSTSAIAEDSPVGTAVGSLSTTDPNAADTHVYSLVPGDGDTDNLAFEIVGGELRTLELLDFETKSAYTVRIRSTDNGGLFVEQSFAIDVQDTNENPTAIVLSNDTLPENSALGTVVGTLTTTDPDTGDSHTYSLATGEGDTDNSLFAVVGNELRVAGTLDFEVKSTYSVRIQSSDVGGLLFEQVFTVTLTDVNEAPTEIALSSHLIFDGAAAGTVVGTMSATDPDAGETAIFALIAGAGSEDNGSFSISGNELSISFAADMAVKSSYQIRVQVTDSAGATYEQNLVLLVVEEPVAPTDISLTAISVAENVAIGTTVGTLSTTDANTSDSHIYALVAGDGDADNAMFSINGNLLVTAAEIDFESQSSFTIRIRSSDAFDLFVDKTFVITVDNVNEAPLSIDLTKSTIADQQPTGTLVGLFETMDPDTGDTFTYSLVPGTGDSDNAQFQIDNGQLRMAASVDAAVQSLYSVRVRSQDAGGLFVEEVLDILVSGVNQAPTDIVLSSTTVSEDATVGTVVASLSTTDGNELDTHTYELVAGSGDTDNGMFTIQGNQLILNASIDFATQPTLTIRIRSTDPYGLTIEEELVITVTEVI